MCVCVTYNECCRMNQKGYHRASREMVVMNENMLQCAEVSCSALHINTYHVIRTVLTMHSSPSSLLLYQSSSFSVVVVVVYLLLLSMLLSMFVAMLLYL